MTDAAKPTCGADTAVVPARGGGWIVGDTTIAAAATAATPAVSWVRTKPFMTGSSVSVHPDAINLRVCQDKRWEMARTVSRCSDYSDPYVRRQGFRL